jgi:hypothetical protein
MVHRLAACVAAAPPVRSDRQVYGSEFKLAKTRPRPFSDIHRPELVAVKQPFV